MRKILVVLLFVVCLLPAKSFSAVEPDYDPSKPPVLTPWFGAVGAAERKADLTFIDGMRPHHEGALSMSKDYLASEHASDSRLKALANGIIRNQTFEIGMLKTVEGFVLPEAPHHGTQWRQIATQGLAQKQRFIRAPLPALWGGGPVSAEDVRFAKAMIIHHEGALQMSKDYLADPAASNKYLRLLCVDILKDQKLDIAFMNSIIAGYPGNPDDIKIDPSMVHGMEGMNHGAGHGEMKAQDHGAVHNAPKAHKPKVKLKPASEAHQGHH